MEAVVVVWVIILEVPSGALADLIGRKKTVLAGISLFVIGIIWFSLMRTPFDAWGANFVWMTGVALCSGADSSLIYDSLKSAGREDEYKKIHGKAIGNRFLLVAFTSLVAGLLADIHLRLPLLLSIPNVIATVAIVYFMSEPRQTRKFALQEQMKLIKISVLFVANHKQVKWIVGFMTLIATASGIWFFSYNPYFELVELDVAYYVFVFFCLNIVAWFFSKYAYKTERIISEQTTVVLMVTLIGAPIFVMGSFVSVAAVSMVLLQNVVRGISSPFFSDFTHKHLSSENRATVVSIQSAVKSLTGCIALALFGLLTKHYSLPFCLQILGISVLFLGALSIWKYRKIVR
jgi:MFS family permease